MNFACLDISEYIDHFMTIQIYTYNTNYTQIQDAFEEAQRHIIYMVGLNHFIAVFAPCE